MILITNKTRLLFYAVIALAVTGLSGLFFLLIEKEPPTHHTPLKCNYSFGDVTVERCENDETICYKNVYSNQGGLSCHWKDGNEELKAKPEEKTMTCSYYSGANELARCENSEAICYSAKGGTSCRFKFGPTKNLNHQASSCEYYSGGSEFYRCQNEEAICYGSQKGGISCKIQ